MVLLTDLRNVLPVVILFGCGSIAYDCSSTAESSPPWRPGRDALGDRNETDQHVGIDRSRMPWIPGLNRPERPDVMVTTSRVRLLLEDELSLPDQAPIWSVQWTRSGRYLALAQEFWLHSYSLATSKPIKIESTSRTGLCSASDPDGITVLRPGERLSLDATTLLVESRQTIDCSGLPKLNGPRSKRGPIRGRWADDGRMLWFDDDYGFSIIDRSGRGRFIRTGYRTDLTVWAVNVEWFEWLPGQRSFSYEVHQHHFFGEEESRYVDRVILEPRRVECLVSAGRAAPTAAGTLCVGGESALALVDATAPVSSEPPVLTCGRSRGAWFMARCGVDYILEVESWFGNDSPRVLARDAKTLQAVGEVELPARQETPVTWQLAVAPTGTHFALWAGPRVRIYRVEEIGTAKRR